MAKRITLTLVYESVLQLAQAVSNMSREHERRFDGIDARLDEHDRKFLFFNRLEQRLAAVER